MQRQSFTKGHPMRRFYPKPQIVASATDPFEVHGTWQKRQIRTEWLAARQAAKAAMRATRADRDARKPLPRALPPPPPPTPRWRRRYQHHRAPVTLEDA